MSKKGRTNRSSSRLAAVQALYMYELGGKSIDEIAFEFTSGQIGNQLIEEDEITEIETFVPVMPAEPVLFAGLLSSYAEHEEQILEMLNASFGEDWPLETVELTFKAILKTGLAELLSNTDTPVAIVITEYLDLTQSFYGPTEIRIMNGILDKYAKILREENLAD